MSKILKKLGLKKPLVIDYWDCSKLGLYELPREAFKHRQTLKTLLISNNHIRDIPKTIFMIEGLEELDISENDILFIPPAISKLTNLTSLIINKNSLAGVPEAIRHCQNLLTLDLSINPLGSLCEGLLELRQLRHLILNDTQLEELPPNIGKLSKLEVLELRENLLHILPSSMVHLSLLEKLDIGNNEFMQLPPVVGSLESLCELWIDCNTISIIPEELGNLHNLRFLEMSENHIMMLPNTISGWSKLTDLYANDNLLSILPDTFGELCSLTIAKLSANRLGGLPDTVYGLGSMAELDLSHNHITELPSAIGGMTSLVSLNLDENLLTCLPPQIGHCILMKNLTVRDNQLFDIPAECGGLLDLRILNVIGNRLSHMPFSLTNLKKLSAIWVAENQSRPIVELQVVKGDRNDKWLTCFLFPQQGRESPFVEAMSPLDKAIDDDPSAKPLHRKSSQVVFDPHIVERRSKLSRDPTPFPKELHSKAMAWRAARDIQPEAEVAPAPVEDSPQPEEVALRNPTRRLVKNRYSLLKAMQDPLDEQLRPTKRYTSATPPNSPPNEPFYTPISPGRYSPSANGQALSELPPMLSTPNGSTMQGLPSGPHLEPPSEFAAKPSLGPGIGQQVGARMGASEVTIRQARPPNSNGNNNNQPERMTRPSHSISLGMVNKILVPVHEHELETPQQPSIYFPSEASTLSRSDVPETRSSMESGFDADNELENQQQAWYNSPNGSPPHRRVSEAQQMIQPTIAQTYHVRVPSDSRDSHNSGSQMSQHESASDDYEKLVFNQSRFHGRSNTASRIAEQRRGSLDAVVMLSAKQKASTFTYGEQDYDQAYPPSHKASRSFDATHHRRRIPPSSHYSGSSHHSQESQHSSKPPISPLNASPNHPSGRASAVRNKRPSQHIRHHSEHVLPVHPPVRHESSNSQPDSRSPSQSHRKNRSHVRSNDSVFHTSYPGHRGVHNLEKRSPPNSGYNPKSANVHHTSRRRFFSDMPSDIAENRPLDVGLRHHSDRHNSYPNYISDESQNSRHSTPLNTPKLGPKTSYASGNDSGFDSMNRNSKVTGKYVVELDKNPTLGLGITGGTNGENAIKPGDQGFHVYKVTKGLPADLCGKIEVGDKLLKVNGRDLTSLTCEDVLTLLTQQQYSKVSLLLYKEPSLTLL